MSKGKFSAPRPRREEDPEIRKAYRQMTGQEPIPESIQEPTQEPVNPAPMGEPESSGHPVSNPASENADLDALLTGLNSAAPAHDALPPRPEAKPASSSAPPTPKQPFRKFFPEEPPAEDEEADSQADEEETFLDKAVRYLGKAMDFCAQNKKIVLVALCALALIVIVGVISVFAAGTADPYDRKILNNVYVAGVNVGGMTKKEAINLVTKSVDDRLSREYMVVELSGNELQISPADASVKLDVKGAVNAAYDYGRTGTNAEKDQAYVNSLTGTYTVPLSSYMEVNKRKLQEALETFAANAGSTLTQTKYGLEGTQPELSLDKFDGNAPGQTLVITMGTPGIQFDTAAVLAEIIDAYARFEFRVTVADAEPVSQPDPLDLDSIYLEFYIAPVNATVDISAHKTIPASYGYGFDVEKAKAMVAQADYGEEIRIPMEYIEPEVMDEELLYRDTLGEYRTAYSRSENRIVNLKLACEAINGFVLDPGETFSFNDQVGQPTTDKGYKYAYVSTGIDEESVVGGGISQVASTLYYSALLSDLQIVSRTNHDRPMSYIDYGLDADIQWGKRDLRFKNNTDYPITIQAEAAGGYISIQLLGTEQRSYYVKLESRIQNTYVPDTKYEDFKYDNPDGYLDGDVIQEGEEGYLVRTYMIKYDRNTNEQLSRNSIADSEYKSIDEILARVEEEPTTEPPTQPSTQPSTEPPTTPTTAPTVPTTEAPSESTTPSSEAPSESTAPSSAAPSEDSPGGESGGENQQDDNIAGDAA